MGPLGIRLLAMSALAIALVVLSGHYQMGQLSYVLLGLAIVIGAMVSLAPSTLMLLFEWMSQTSHAARWHSRQGRHYEFVGISLDLREDGEHAWMRADGLKRVLDVSEADDIFAARVASGRWVREGRWLWVRVDAVVQHLAEAPDRDAPRRRRLRQHLEREVLAPLQRRRGGNRMSAVPADAQGAPCEGPDAVGLPEQTAQAAPPGPGPSADLLSVPAPTPSVPEHFTLDASVPPSPAGPPPSRR